MKDIGIQLVVTRSAGTDHIHLKTAGDMGIKVANAPGYSPTAIAEHCIALTLALFRKFKPSIFRIKDYNFSLNGLVGTEIHGKTFGICGTGDIGEALAQIANGFGAKVLLYDKDENINLKKNDWANYTTKKELLEQSDIISLNLPLTEETKDFISLKEIGLIKDSAVLINTGRGELVKTKQILTALKHGNLAGYGLDVYENEKDYFFQDLSHSNKRDRVMSSLIEMNNVVLTAHQAFLTGEALQSMMNTVFKNINDFMEGNEMDGLVSSE